MSLLPKLVFIYNLQGDLDSYLARLVLSAAVVNVNGDCGFVLANGAAGDSDFFPMRAVCCVCRRGGRPGRRSITPRQDRASCYRGRRSG